MFEKKSRELIKVTPKIAERVLLSNEFKGQRDLTPKWVSYLANCIREDLFTVGHIGVVIYQNGKEESKYLINGQHQLNAVLVANKPIEAVLDIYQCDSPEDVSLLYRQFDNYKSRSLINLVSMELYSLGYDWPSKIANLVVSAAACVRNMRFAHKTLKVELLKPFSKEGEFIKRIITNIPDGNYQKHSAHLCRAPVVHAMILTWYKCQSDSERFWVDIRDGEDLKRSMPQYKVREFLKQSNVDRGRGAVRNNRNPVSEHEMTSRCITGWNAFRENKSTKLTYYPNKPIPKAK